MQKINYYELEEKNQPAWELICSGRTKGVFQLDSNLGQSWAKRMKPIGIEEMSDLASIIRPGCLNAIEDGKSMTQHYVDRKFGVEMDNPLHPSLQSSLGSTYQILVYQEQAMAIARELGGFTLEQADNLRKAIGKKDTDIMKKCDTEFTEGCKKEGIVDEETAKRIFGWIRESQKYSFNKSHGVSYAKVGYWTAYMKANYTPVFLCASMNHPGSLEPADVIRQLILEAKSYGISVYPPSINSQMNRFSIKNGAIYFGLTAIKSVGEARLQKMLDLFAEQKKSVDKMSWVEILPILNRSNSECVEALISVGYFDFLPMSRMQMLHEYKTFSEFSASTIKQYLHVVDNFPELISLNEIMKKCISIYDDSVLFKSKKPFNVNVYEKLKDRLQILEQSNYPKDSIDWICRKERELLGIELTYSKLDKCDLVASNTTCSEIQKSGGENLVLACEIVSSREYIIKDGKNAGQVMCFLTLADKTGYIDSVVFANIYKAKKNVFYEGNTVVVSGNVGERGSLIVQKVEEI